MKIIFIFLLTLSALAANAKENAKIKKCAERIQKECNISNNDKKRIVENATVCKQINGFDQTLEGVVLDSGDVTIVEVTNNCKITKFDLGYRAEIDDMKVIGGRAYMSTKTGAAYYIRATDQGPVFREILKSNKTPYAGIKDIKGNQGGTEIQFLDVNGSAMQIVDGQISIGSEEIERLDDKHRLRVINFFRKIPTEEAYLEIN